MPGPLHDLVEGREAGPGIGEALPRVLESLRRILIAVVVASVAVSVVPVDTEAYVPLISVVPSWIVDHVLPEAIEWRGHVIEVHVVQYHPFASFTVLLKTALLLGVLASSPIIAREIGALLSTFSPGRKAREAYWLIASSIALFLLGVVVALYVVIPWAFRFTIIMSVYVFAPYEPIAFADIEQLFSTIILIMVATGLAFEAPLAAYYLVSRGVVSEEWFTGQNKRYVLAGSMALGAVISPDPSGIGMLVVGSVMFASIILAARLGARRRKAEAGDEAGQDH